MSTETFVITVSCSTKRKFLGRSVEFISFVEFIVVYIIRMRWAITAGRAYVRMSSLRRRVCKHLAWMFRLPYAPPAF